MTRRQLCDAFADALRYPDQDFPASLAALRALAGAGGGEDPEGSDLPPVRQEVEAFLQETRHLSVEEAEELYTRTFDINPITSLEVGWHLYGETYERGSFLVRMRTMLRAQGIPESTELPDHLCHVLRLLGRQEPAEAEALVRTALLPALAKMQEGFTGQTSPYAHLLRALATIAEQLHAQPVRSHV